MKSEQEVVVANALEADPNVLRWRYEAKRLVYDYKGKLRTYIVDFTIWLRDGSILFLEIKPANHSPTAMDEAKWTEARARLGPAFRVIEEWKS